MVSFQIIGNDFAITMAAEAGQLELNVMEPLIAFNLMFGIKILTNAIKTIRTRTIDGITVNKEVCMNYVINSIGIVTALNPVIGYEKSSHLAKRALETGRSVYDIALEEKVIDEKLLKSILTPERLTRMKIPEDQKKVMSAKNYTE